jgi:hypothetical protein
MGACARQPEQPAGGDAQAAKVTAGKPSTGPAPFTAELPLEELMAHVMQYSADGIWKRQGLEIDARGEHSLYPKNTEQWEEAESAALTLAEVTNTLLVPGRRIDDPKWDQAVEGVRKIAREAAAAAERQDKAAFFKAGEKLDAACDVCHERFDPRFDPRYKQ